MRKRPRIYLDTSVLGRVLDDYTHDAPGSRRQRNRGRAAHAAHALLSLLESGALEGWISGQVAAELRLARDGPWLLRRLRGFLKCARVLPRDIRRAARMAAMNLSVHDALHAAVAERIGATALLTADGGFVTGARLCANIKVVEFSRWVKRAASDAVKRTQELRRSKQRARKRL